MRYPKMNCLTRIWEPLLSLRPWGEIFLYYSVPGGRFFRPWGEIFLYYSVPGGRFSEKFRPWGEIFFRKSLVCKGNFSDNSCS